GPAHQAQQLGLVGADGGAALGGQSAGRALAAEVSAGRGQTHAMCPQVVEEVGECHKITSSSARPPSAPPGGRGEVVGEKSSSPGSRSASGGGSVPADWSASEGSCGVCG